MAHPITAYLSKHKISKSELARRADISWRRLQLAEKGEVLTAETARRLHAATGGALNAATLLDLPTPTRKAS